MHGAVIPLKDLDQLTVLLIFVVEILLMSRKDIYPIIALLASKVIGGPV